eukprot:TRINITY_DN19590_c0_g1_i1.p1 TRINITY_DN19590_c0_g1~~TRINITY_DN19590_c0_g1_i1.p1  ORF type:complete len:173 (-),score=12.11 TRINITY_DN19590_c0_g1_i1:59-511(-)
MPLKHYLILAVCVNSCVAARRLGGAQNESAATDAATTSLHSSVSKGAYPGSSSTCGGDPSHCVTCAGGLGDLTDFCGNSGQDNWCAGPKGQGSQCLCPHRVMMYLKVHPKDASHFDASTCADDKTSDKDLNAGMPVNSQQLADLKQKCSR